MRWANELSVVKDSKQSLRVVWLASIFAMSSCGGGSVDTTTPAPPPPVTAPTPPQAVGEVLFTLDNSVTKTLEVPAVGGQLVLDVPAGATFTLGIPKGAFFSPNTTVTLQSIVDTQGLAAGLTPVAAVSLAPSGANFAVHPTLEVDLRGLSRPIGNIVFFLANDDGTGLTYLLPQGDDPVATVLGDGPYAARVPHFSGVGIVVSDPNGPDFPAAVESATAEQKARQEITRRISIQAREVLMGQRVMGEPIADIEQILAGWLEDIRRRVDAFDDDASTGDFVSITNEILRIEQTRRDLAVSDVMSRLEDVEAGPLIIAKVTSHIQVLNDRCIAGNTSAPQRIADLIKLLRDLVSVNLLNESTLMSIDQPDFCIATGT